MYTIRDAQIAYDNRQPEEYGDMVYTGQVIIDMDGSSVLFEYINGIIINVTCVNNSNVVTYAGTLKQWKHPDKIEVIEKADEVAQAE